MNKIPNLDPEYKEATKRLNRFFSEKVKDIREVSIKHLLWYLCTTLLWKEHDVELINANYEYIDDLHIERIKMKAELARLKRDGCFPY